MPRKRSVKPPPTQQQFDGSAWLDINNPLFSSLNVNKDAPIVVNESSSLHCITILTCVRMIAETIASLPHCIYKRLPNGGKEKAPDHPWWYLLHDAPNVEMDWRTFIETLAAHVLNNGNAYAQIDWTKGGDLVALYPALPDGMTVGRSSTSLVYTYTSQGIKANILPEDICHIKWLGYDGLSGYSPIGLIKKTIEFAMRQEKSQNDLHQSGNQPGGILKTTLPLKDEGKKALRENWLHQAKNRGIPVLPPGVEWQTTGITQEEAQWVEGRGFTDHQLYNMYRVPIELVTGSGDQKEATIQFANRCILPLVKRFEAEFNRKLFPPLADGTPNDFFCKFVVDGLLRADIQTRYAAYSTGIQWGYLSPARVAELEDQEPIPGGDRFFQPLNMVPFAVDGKALTPEEMQAFTKPQPDPANPSQKNPDQLPSDRPDPRERTLIDAFSPQLYETLRRMTTREEKNIQDIIGKPDYHAKVAEYYRKHQEKLYEALEPTYVGLAAALGCDANRSHLRMYINGYCGQAVMRALTGQLEPIKDEQLIQEANDTIQTFMRGLHGT